MSRPHVLLIDDEHDIREVATLSLEMTGGWRVTSAGGGSEGIAHAHADRPDVIVLDVMMPDLDGPATLGRLQADPLTRGIPVIFLTAKAQSADHRGYARLGVAGTLTKPFDPMTLADQITTILTREDRTP
jgi:two-component system alkaline phosphatase synthesis response regulator PhoP